MQGKEYISENGKLVAAKNFIPVESCCYKKCFNKCSLKLQQRFHETFWGLQDSHKQNILLSSLIKSRDPDTLQFIERERLIRWIYYFPTDEDNIVVCKKFICDVLSLGRRRIEILQKKMLLKQSLDDARGKHDKHLVKLSNDVQELIKIHCESIPHQRSQYTRESTTLNYFCNPELNLTTLYYLFLEYYTSVTGNLEIPLRESTYSKFFNHNVNFAFKLPRTDVCNQCYESSVTQQQSTEIIIHKQEVREYQALKKKFLSEENALKCEFDYAQNLPLPKIPVSEQFYKRLLWLYLFNVHVFNCSNSYMFPFLEGSAKKGANTVCSFVDSTIEREYDKNIHKKIVLFSDAASGQNRNYTVFAFSSALSVKHNVEIWHVFPVRGHSYCQCDRNFGLYSQKKKKKERIETPDEYIELIRDSKDPPFIMVESPNKVLHDFEKTFKGKVRNTNAIKISTARVIHYLPNGNVECYRNYELNEPPDVFKINLKIKLADIIKVSPLIVGITKQKKADVESLLKYLSSEAQQIYKNYFASITDNKEVDDTILSDEEES